MVVGHSERVLDAGNSSRGVAETFGFATNRSTLDLLGLERCEKVLHYVLAWRQVYAMAAPALASTPNSAQSFTPNNSESDNEMELIRFSHKGLRQIHADDNATGVQSAMADKLLFALETADGLDQLSRFLGRMEAASAQGRPERILELGRHRKLALDFLLRRRIEHGEQYRPDRPSLGGPQCP